MTAFEIPAITYAIFPVRPKNRAGWGMAIANAKGYAYTVWLPKSGYEPGGEIDDFEYHDERSTRSRTKNIGFGNLVNDPEIILDDLTVFETRGSRKLRGHMTAFRVL